MSRRTKIQSKVIRGAINDKNVLGMFQDLLGMGEGGKQSHRLDIIYPKYVELRSLCGRFVKILEVLGNSVLMQTKHHREAALLKTYVAALKTQLESTFCAPQLETLYAPPKLLTNAPVLIGAPLEEKAEIDYRKVPKSVMDAVAVCYEKTKTSNVVNIVIVSCKNLTAYRKSLADKDKLRPLFLTKSGGLTFAPLPDLDVNFKKVYNTDLNTPGDKIFVLTVLHKLFEVTHATYEVLSAPDVDPDEFVEVVSHSIRDVRRHIPRCDEAFAKIEESMTMLKSNFGEYYKDFVASNNPTIILENFVLDVSKSTNSSPRVTMQFRKIISHYRKISSQQSQNPKLKAIFGQVDKQFRALELSVRQSKEESAPEVAPDEEDGVAPGEVETLSPKQKKTLKNRKKRIRKRVKKVQQSLFDELERDKEPPGGSEKEEEPDEEGPGK